MAVNLEWLSLYKGYISVARMIECQQTDDYRLRTTPDTERFPLGT